MSPTDDMGGGLRKRRTGFFVQVPRDTIRDSALSFKGRGILTFLLDMPDGWDVRSEWIATQSDKDGRDAVQSGLRELRVRGYYRLERRRLLDGTLLMGTAISESSVPEWVEQNAAFNNKPVLCVQQRDGSFKVKMPDGSLVNDGFEGIDTPDSDPTAGQELTVESPAGEGSEATGVTGTGFPGAGESGSGQTGAGFSDSGSSDSGKPRAIRENETGDREGSSDSSLRSESAGPDDDDDPDPTPPSKTQPKAKASRGDNLTPRAEAATHDGDALPGLDAATSQVSRGDNLTPPTEGPVEEKPNPFAVAGDFLSWFEATHNGGQPVMERDRTKAALAKSFIAPALAAGATLDQVKRALAKCLDRGAPTEFPSKGEWRTRLREEMTGNVVVAFPGRGRSYADEETYGTPEERQARLEALQARPQEDIDAEVDAMFQSTRRRPTAE